MKIAKIYIYDSLKRILAYIQLDEGTVPFAGIVETYRQGIKQISCP
jgi:hypothetical protein